MRVAEEFRHSMSRSGLAKKLQPAKKALKRFTKTLKSKLHDLNHSKAVRVIKTSTDRLLAYCSSRFFLPFKKRFIAKPRGGSRQYDRRYSNKTPLHSTLSTIYIDNLYASEPSLTSARHFHSRAETSGRGKAVAVEKVVPRKEDETGEKSVYSIEDAWREVVARSPHLRPVDERAEEFIYKFREEIKLQKEK
ncbi:hypothetical protein DKX38_013221 [Salix brachista]|uniref:Uncharacterized protein n=1 Tax=Salix brachista TaxID=2182728 RepID=A0A5N5LQS4_9ROSI|nr:hypothetical protein DKX38_013221 [Salix brachista]